MLIVNWSLVCVLIFSKTTGLAMWLLIFAGAAQALLILERVLNRVVLVAVPSKRSETKKLSDRYVIGALSTHVYTAVMTLVSTVVLFAELLLRHSGLVFGILLLMIVLTVVADSSTVVYVAIFNTYNSGIGLLIYLLAILPLQLAHLVLGKLVPLYNAIVWLAARLLKYVLFPVVRGNVEMLPELIENVSLFAGACGLSTYTFIMNVLGCVSDTQVFVAGTPYVEPNLQCFANTNHMTLDLMTPGFFLRGIVRSSMGIVAGSCSVLSPIIDAVLYPLLDYNLYKAIHCAVHAVIHVVVALPIITYQRCMYGRSEDFSQVERAVMCMPDWTPAVNVLCALYRALGDLIDNWLNAVLAVIERNIGVSVLNCNSLPSIGNVWEQVSTEFDEQAGLRVVGLTHSMYAMTDGRSTAYYTLVDGTRLQRALFNWPFHVDTRFGIASIQYADVQDTDSEGASNTGMLGCACSDGPEGLQISCASVPYQIYLEDEAYAQATVHKVLFDFPRAASVMTCAGVQIQVVSLRFSRRRYSQPLAGIDVPHNDAFGTNTAARSTIVNTADAAVYVHPRCRVDTDGTDSACLPESANCFPWCMGLHIAGRKNQQIVLVNQVTWENNVNLAQTDCVIATRDEGCVATSGKPKPVAVSAALGESYQSECDFQRFNCRPDDNVMTWEPSSPMDRVVYARAEARPTIRLAQQPFVSAGDIFLYHVLRDTRNEVVIARLRSAGSSEFTVRQDALSIDSNALAYQVYDGPECEVLSNDECYNNAVLADQVVLPRSYTYWAQEYSAVAVSEWAVHWVDSPELSVLGCVWARCHATVPELCLNVESSFGRARVWSLKSVRSQHTMGIPTLDDPSVAFMTVPNWLSSDFSPAQCHQIVNIMVVGLEYINSNNLLLTTKATSPSNFQDNRVVDETLCEYRHYFIHPNRADCYDVYGTEPIYSCFREQSMGMFAAETEVYASSPGRMCPAMQRMPQLGSAGAEYAVCGTLALRVVLQALFTLPAAGNAGRLSNLFQQRERLTHHSVLDTGGLNLVDVDGIIYSLELGNHHVWNSLGKLSELLRGKPGHAQIEGVLVGTSKIMAHMSGQSQMTGAAGDLLNRVLKSVKTGSTPVADLSAVATSSPVGNMPTPIASLRRMFLQSTSTVSLGAKMIRRLVLILSRVTDAGISTGVLTIALYESRTDIRISWLDHMRAQCDGLSQIIGHTNPWAKMVRNACLLGPDGVEGFLQAMMTFLVSYPLMNCVCKLPEGRDSKEFITQVCLQNIMPIDYTVWTKTLRTQNNAVQQSMCFRSMDFANHDLLTAMDPFLSRLFQVTQAMESSIDYLTAAFVKDGGHCEDLYGSAYSITLMPEPVDYFMQCIHTFDCRARCLDTHAAFDAALQAVGNPPTYTHSRDVTVQSRYFSSSDMENDRHMPPFLVRDLRELPPDLCQQYICKNTRYTKGNHCVAVAGTNSNYNPSIAYYCVPGDISQFVFAYPELPFSNKEAQYASVFPDKLMELHVLTISGVRANRRDDLLALTLRGESEGRQWCLYRLESIPSLARFELLVTQPWNPLVYDTSSSRLHRSMQRIDRVWVVHAQTLTYVFVGGVRMVPARNGNGYESAKACVRIEIQEAAALYSACEQYMQHILQEHHQSICVSSNCSTIVAIPSHNSETAEVRVITFDFASGDASVRTVVAKTRSGKGISSALNMGQQGPLYLTKYDRVAESQRHLSAITYSNLEKMVILLSGTGRQAWIQNVRIQVVDGEYRGERTMAESVVLSVNISITCSLDNCVGCMPNVLQNKKIDTRFEHLQGMCLAAQECSISRCVGTTVNLRKPLCNIAKVLSSQMDIVRVGIGGMWMALSRQIIMIVELSENRRLQYEISWPEEAFNAGVCNTKDALVETTATLTSILGAISHSFEQKAGQDVGARSSKIDTRYHARFVMVLAATTTFLSSVFMGPLYALIAAQKTITCLTNDAILVLDNMISGDTDGEPLIMLGSKKGIAASDSSVGMCLSQLMGATLRDISTRANKIDNEIQLMLEQINDLMNRMPFEPLQHMLDAAFAYLIGLISGIMDVVQTYDMYHCKLPVVGQSLVWTCVCGDTPVRIPGDRRGAATDNLWCQGPLLLNSPTGEDVLVWNPFPFEQLISMQDYDAYLGCLERGTDCADGAPNALAFAEQGVEIMQVITRCRANYQQRQWDEGAMFLGLFSPAQWRGIHDIPLSAVDLNEPNGPQKLRILQIRQSVDVRVHESVIECFRQAIADGERTPACMRTYLQRRAQAFSGIDEYFHYEKTTGDSFAKVDACQSFSGKMQQLATPGYSAVGSVMPVFLWSGSSANKVPVAARHLLAIPDRDTRMQRAQDDIEHLFRSEIKPFFAKTHAVSEQVSVSALSTEADEIHQYVDCVIMGPFASADMQSSFTMNDGETFPVEQYFRHQAHSREFEPHGDGVTGGSRTRKQIMASVRQKASTYSQIAVKAQTLAAVHAIRSLFSRVENLFCLCPDNTGPSMACCEQHGWTSESQITFPASHALSKRWDVGQEVIGDILGQIKLDKLLSVDVWTDPLYTNGSPHPLSPEAEFELQRMYLFDPTVTVREYSSGEVMRETNKGTLWQNCMALLSSGFFSLPVRVGSNPPEVDADMRYDPTLDPGEFMHGMEGVVQRILRRARRDSPVFWTHVHRYMPTDSMWCEDWGSPTPLTPEATFAGGNIDTLPVDKDRVLVPRVTDVRSVSGLGARCFCGWQDTVGCRVHSSLNCSGIAHKLADAGPWQQLCERGGYSSREDLFLLMQVLEEAGADTPECADVSASTVWGLMDWDHQHRWWEGGEADIGLQDLATYGPAGLRLGLLGAGPDSLGEHVSAHKLILSTRRSVNYRLGHTIAQPVCEQHKEQYLHNNFSTYFRDVLFPMAHTVHESPVGAYCSTWAIEYAILHFFTEAQLSSDIIAEQDLLQILWKERCTAQLQQIGICQLRGVYGVKPKDGSADSASHCAFAIAETTGCDFIFITPNCLVMCDDVFFDPCLGSELDCSMVVFAKHVGPPLAFDARHYATTPEVQLFSMHWPTVVALQETSPDQRAALNELLVRISTETGFDSDVVHADVRAVLIARDAGEQEGVSPHAFCDDVLDYWDADAEHPVGYHPTCACDQNETNMRGFTSWMSSDDDGQSRVDPLRQRNMTEFSSRLGASHVLCDAGAYGLPERELNPYYLESLWDSLALSDPTVPVVTNFPEEFMFNVGNNPEQLSTDTPLVAGTGDFRHSLGLVRDWHRGFGFDITAPWPHWDESHDDSYGDAGRGGDCSVVAQYTCSVDTECISLSPHEFVCLTNPFGKGVCVQKEYCVDEVCLKSCFTHDHCHGESDKMCSGRGFCEKIVLVVENALDKPVFAQLFARTCALDPYGFSTYEGVSDFASANGMCGARNRYEYWNLTGTSVPTTEHGRDGSSRIFRVPDNFYERSDTTLTAASLSDAQVLRAQAHQCDRSYQHSDHRICMSTQADNKGGRIDYALGSNFMWALRTWENIDNVATAKFCDIEHDQERSKIGFLSPYTYFPVGGDPESTLRHVAETVLPCSTFEICPEVNFMVDGRSVLRRVQIAFQDAILRTIVLSRPFSNRDADHCMGMGYRVQRSDGVLADREFEERCVVDRHTVPLLTVVFSDRLVPLELETQCTAQVFTFCREKLRQIYDNLRRHCPRAFGVADTAFQSYLQVFEIATRPYTFEESLLVLDTVNRILPMLFGIDPSQDSTRGFADEEAYLEHGRCARFIVERMAEIQNTVSYTRDVTQTISTRNSLYFFQERSAVYMPFRWFWQCVVLSSSGDGGAPSRWFDMLINSQNAAAHVSCPNYVYVTRSPRITLRKRLETALLVFESPDDISTVDSQLQDDVVTIINLALSRLRLTSVPNVDCMSVIDTKLANDNSYILFPAHTTAKENFDFLKYASRPVGIVNNETRLQDIIHVQVRMKLLPGVTEETTWSVKQLLQAGILVKRALSGPVDSGSPFIPTHEFSSLQTLEIPAQKTHFYDNGEFFERVRQGYAYDSQGESGCRKGDYTLRSPEFEMLVYGTKRDEYPDNMFLSQTSGEDDYLENNVYFTQIQVVYMVMRYMKVFMFERASMHSQKLSAVLSQEIDFHMGQADPGLLYSGELDLSKYKSYNAEMRRKTFECNEMTSINYDSETNNAFQSLRRCHKTLQQRVGWSLGLGGSVSIPVDRAMLMGGFYPSFSTAHDSDQFVANLTSRSWSQSAWRGENHNSMCFSREDTAEIMNPYMSGAFDEGTGCECQLSAGEVWTIDGRCSAFCRIRSPGWQAVLDDMTSHCQERDGEVLVRHNRQYKSYHTPICQKVFQSPGTCSIQHGSVGGMPGEAVSDIHVSQTISSLAGGLWSDSEVWRGGVMDTLESLQLLGSDIGGHALVFEVTTYGQLRVARTVMGSVFTSDRQRVERWRPNVKETWKQSHVHYTPQQYHEATDTSWVCPLQWLSAYSGIRKPYEALYPSAMRNKVRFAHLTATSQYAHPTVSGTRTMSFLSAGRFVSEFWGCTAANHTMRSDHLSDTLSKLRSAHDWHTVQWDAGGDSVCAEVLDWPMQSVNLVDGDTHTVPADKPFCNVYSRLPRFRLRLAVRGPRPALLSFASSCRMGRLRRLGPAPDSNFAIQYCGSLDTGLSCVVAHRNGSRGSTQYLARKPFVPDRKPRKRHRRCSSCDKHAPFDFVHRNGSTGTLNSQRPAMSVGQPVKISTARMLAAHLRRAVCGARATCSQLQELLSFDANTWQRSNFLQHVLRVPAKENITHTDDGPLWDRSWVWCQDGNCSGSVHKNEWIDPRQRETGCAREITKAAGALRIPVHLCLVDANTEEMCARVKTWHAQVGLLICRALGMPQCQEAAHFYSPTMYSSSNSEFVHDTVQTFYDNLPESQCARPEESTEQIMSNEKLLSRCPSTELVPVKEALMMMREIKTLLIELYYYFAQICSQLGSLLVSAIMANEQMLKRAGDKLMLYVEIFIARVLYIMDELARVMFKVIFGQGLPEEIVKILRILCDFYNWVQRDIVGTSPDSGVLCVLFNLLGRAYGILADAFEAIMNLDILGTRPFKILFFIPATSMRFASNFFLGALPCNTEGLMMCDFTDIPEDNIPDGALPVATRCFSTYTTFYGDGQPLSCTQADTCHTSLVDRSVIMCGSCEHKGSTKRFGCSPITKICTCAVPVMVETPCNANSDCYEQDQTCRLLDSQFNPGFGGFQRCAVCQNSRMCFLQPGRTSGYCACGLQEIHFDSCQLSQLGTSPALRIDSMCLHTRDPNFKTTLSGQSYDNMLTVPCNHVNSASSFCTRVSGASAEAYMVSSSITGRRLLALEEAVPESTHNGLCKDALSSTLLPATREGCAASFHFSLQTIALLEMQKVLPPCFFCSIEDVMAEITRNPLLLPVMGMHPARLMHMLSRHTPLYYVSGAMSSLHTVLTILVEDYDHNETTPSMVALLDFVNKSTSSRRLLVFSPTVQISALSEKLKAQGRAFSDKYDRMSDMQTSYKKTLSSFLSYNTDNTVATAMWDSSTFVSHPLSGEECTPLLDVLSIIQRAFNSTTMYYEQPELVWPSSKIADSWPKLPFTAPEQGKAAWDQTLDLVSASVLWVVRSLMRELRLDSGNLRTIFLALTSNIMKNLQCNLEQVQTCSGWEVRILNAVLVVLVYAVVIYYLMSALNLSMFAVLILPSLPFLVMYLAYGYTPACVPLIPTCFLPDVYNTLEYLFPKAMSVPNILFRDSVRAPAQLTACREFLRTECLKDCTLAPFEYGVWTDVLAWACVEVGADIYEPVVGLLESVGFAGNVRLTIATKKNVYELAEQSLVDANRICAFVSFYKVLPLILFLILILFAMFAFTRLVMAVLLSMIMLVNCVFVSVYTN